MMNKEILKNAYAIIFLLSLLMGFASIEFKTNEINDKWAAFVTFTIVSFLSLLAYRRVSKFKR